MYLSCGSFCGDKGSKRRFRHLHIPVPLKLYRVWCIFITHIIIHTLNIINANPLTYIILSLFITSTSLLHLLLIPYTRAGTSWCRWRGWCTLYRSMLSVIVLRLWSPHPYLCTILPCPLLGIILFVWLIFFPYILHIVNSTRANCLNKVLKGIPL